MMNLILRLHRCAHCPIRCNAVKRPHSIFARIHRWHKTWWPGWKIYQEEQRSSIPSMTRISNLEINQPKN